MAGLAVHVAVDRGRSAFIAGDLLKGAL